jgi:hypothetical protein
MNRPFCDTLSLSQKDQDDIEKFIIINTPVPLGRLIAPDLPEFPANLKRRRTEVLEQLKERERLMDESKLNLNDRSLINQRKRENELKEKVPNRIQCQSLY